MIRTVLPLSNILHKIVFVTSDYPITFKYCFGVADLFCRSLLACVVIPEGTQNNHNCKSSCWNGLVALVDRKEELQCGYLLSHKDMWEFWGEQNYRRVSSL